MIEVKILRYGLILIERDRHDPFLPNLAMTKERISLRS
jgi:hypothetical protein